MILLKLNFLNGLYAEFGLRFLIRGGAFQHIGLVGLAGNVLKYLTFSEL
jgi:hypothetical protein